MSKMDTVPGTAKEASADAIPTLPSAMWMPMPSTRSHLKWGQMRPVDVHVNVCSTFACDALDQMLRVWARDILGLNASFAWATYGHGLSVLETGTGEQPLILDTRRAEILHCTCFLTCTRFQINKSTNQPTNRPPNRQTN